MEGAPTLPAARAAWEATVSKLKSLRLDAGLLERVEAIASEYGMEFSAAVRWLIKRGLAAAEAEKVNAAAPRRRVLSRGVD